LEATVRNSKSYRWNQRWNRIDAVRSARTQARQALTPEQVRMAGFFIILLSLTQTR
jgi:hypothetical protein